MSVTAQLRSWIPENLLIETEDGVFETTIPIKDLETNLLYAYEHLKFYWLKDICVLEHDSKFILRYVLQNPQCSTIFIICSSIEYDQEVPSVAPIWKSALIYEAEAFELFGVKFNYEIKRNLFPNNTSEFPLRKDFKGFSQKNTHEITQYDHQMKIGLDFPMNTNDIFFHVDLDNDDVANCDLEFGFKHFGLEKSLENKYSEDILNKINLLNTSSASVWTTAWAMLVEQANEIKLPEKAQGLRMIILEMNRIKEHLKVLLQIAYKTDYNSLFNTLLYWYNRTIDQMESYSHRNGISSSIVIGGVRDDIPMGWIGGCLDYLGSLEKHLLDEYKFFYRNSFWFDRLQIGKVDRDMAMKFAVAGPTLRSCGVNHDHRKRKPFYFYQDVSFEIPLGVNGFAYDRFLVYVEEIFQSIKIITQVLDNIPAGDIISEDILNFDKYKSGSFIDDEVLYRRSIENKISVQNKEGIISLEAANGLIDIWAKFNKNGLSDRVKCISNSSKLLFLFQNSIVGEKLEDLQLYWLSLGVQMSEVEK